MHKSILFGVGIAGLFLFLNRKKLETRVKNIISRAAFILTHKNDVIKANTGTHLFPSVTMAQAILESNNGNSGLTRKYNNFFGIKANKHWVGKKVIVPTREVFNGKSVIIKQPFRVYNSAIDSFKDHAEFLITNSNYTKAGVFQAITPEQQAIALQKARYATDPKYASLLISLINKYNLKSLDS